MKALEELEELEELEDLAAWCPTIAWPRSSVARCSQ